MQLTVASFNIRKAIGTDRKRNPERILNVLEEIDADIVALQEADKRVGTRGAAVPHDLIEDHGGWRVCTIDRSHFKLLDLVPDHELTRPLMGRLDTRNLGWHGNAILVRSDIKILEAHALDLPRLEPRGAVVAEMETRSGPVRVVGMHLDLSGLYRERQVEAILADIEGRPKMPTILMGDTNEWTTGDNCLDALLPRFTSVPALPSYHSRKPVAALDRIFLDRGMILHDHGVHRSALAHAASDHLPIWARIGLGLDKG